MKFDANSFIDDRYMPTLLLRGFGCEMPIRANFGEFWGILTPKSVKVLFLPPKVRSSRGDTRFEILRAWAEFEFRAWGLAGAHGDSVYSASVRSRGKAHGPLCRRSGGHSPPEADQISLIKLINFLNKSLLQVTVCQSCDS